MYYIVKYSSQFGFIKPWTAVRDGLTFSQQFLTASTVEGIEKKLFPELLDSKGIFKIKAYKLVYDAMDLQQEVVHTRGVKQDKKTKKISRDYSIIKRGVLLNPIFTLAFANHDDAYIASKQHICLCRNEDVLLPSPEIDNISEADFDKLPGFELKFGKTENSFMVGFNRYDDAKPMFGEISVNLNNDL